MSRAPLWDRFTAERLVNEAAQKYSGKVEIQLYSYRHSCNATAFAATVFKDGKEVEEITTQETRRVHSA